MSATEPPIHADGHGREPGNQRPRSILQKCFSFPILMGAVLVAANFEIVKSLRLTQNTWWQLKYGNLILQTGHWPTVDNWSFTVHGMPRIAYAWGGEVVMALAYRLGGLRGMDILLISLTSIFVLLLYYFAWLRCRNSKAAFVGTVLMMPLAALCFTVQPRLMGYIFLLITLILLERYRQGEQKHLWALPLIFLLWVNTHGSFLLGLFIVILYWLSGLKKVESGRLTSTLWQPAQRIHMEIVCLLSVVALAITPYGTQLATAPLKFATSLPSKFADFIGWQPISTNFWQAKLLLLLLFLFIAAQIAFRYSYRLEELALFLVATYLTFVHFRFAILYAIVFAPLAAAILARWSPTYNPKADKYAVNAVLIFGTVALMVLTLPSKNKLEAYVTQTNPVKAVQYLDSHPIPGRMFNDSKFGGYLVWARAPQHKVFIDGRGYIYERAGVFAGYADVANLKPETMAVLKTYRIHYCLLERHSAVATLLKASPSWKLVYQDTVSTIFVRRETGLTLSPGLSAERKAQPNDQQKTHHPAGQAE